MREIVTSVLFGAVLLVSAAQAVSPDFLETAQGDYVRGLAEQDQARAWEALQPLRERWEGDPGFDLLLGSSAMAVGAWQEAVLALERVEFIAPQVPGVRPTLLRARLELQQSLTGQWTHAADLTARPEADADGPDRTELVVLRQLADEGRWAEAWGEAQRLVAVWEGDEEFDYLFGLAALEQGEVTEAVFALERVLFFNPRRLGARAQLARAYFLEGNIGRADAEFRKVLAGNPPDSVRRSVEGYLDEIARQGNTLLPRLRGQLQVAGGFDTNVNAATSGETIDTPAGSFPLEPGGQAQESGYNRVGARLFLSVPRAQRRSVDLMLSASLRHNVSAPEFDLDIYNSELTYVMGGTDGALRLSGRANAVMLDDDLFQWSTGGRVEWRRSLDQWRLASNLLLTMIRYPDDDLRDVDQALLTGSAGYLFDSSMATVEIFGGQDNAQRSAGEHFGRDFIGVSASYQQVFMNDHLPYLRVAYQQQRHHAEHPVFAQRRRDVQAAAVAGWSWFVTEDFTARAELSYTDVDSSIELFDFDRTRLETALLYRF